MVALVHIFSGISGRVKNIKILKYKLNIEYYILNIKIINIKRYQAWLLKKMVSLTKMVLSLKLVNMLHT